MEKIGTVIISTEEYLNLRKLKECFDENASIQSMESRQGQYAYTISKILTNDLNKKLLQDNNDCIERIENLNTKLLVYDNTILEIQRLKQTLERKDKILNSIPNWIVTLFSKKR